MFKHIVLGIGLSLSITSAFALSDKPYLTESDVNFSALLPPPPAESSPAGQRDLETLLALQKKITPAQMADIQRDLDQSVYTVAGPVFGEKFTKENFPLAGQFFAKVAKDAGIGVGPIKRVYKKLRPFQSNKAVQVPDNIAKVSMGPTYPSGHSTTGAEAAILLSMMVPEKREALFARGWEFGVNRMASGAAYPSDWEAGHITATLAVDQMLRNPDFRNDFDAVKKEIRSGLGLN